MSNWGTTPAVSNLLDHGKRPLTYSQAIYEATRLALADDPRVRVFGEGATDALGIYGTTKGLHQEFKDRVWDMPLSEGLITGLGIGMALAGLRPIVIHPRNDFLLLGLDQLCNHAAKWRFMFGDKPRVPMTVRSVACRGWGSGSQHAQALHSIVAHFPGLNVLVPFTPSDAKGFLLWSVLESSGPTVIMEHKWLWNLKGDVPPGVYTTRPGPPQVLKEGKDVTLVGISYGVAEALIAAKDLEGFGIDAEVIDVRSLTPLWTEIMCESVEKTSRIAVIDTGHTSYGASGEIISRVVEGIRGKLRARPLRIGLPDTPVPAGSESTFYYDAVQIRERVLEMFYRGGKRYADTGHRRSRLSRVCIGP
jgi:pyruvate dehydrogenase E1 component beta subunit